MTLINIKGHEFASPIIRDSFDRRATQFKNKIISALRRIGLTEDDIEIDLEGGAKNMPASASWYMGGNFLHYSYSSSSKYVENLGVVFKVVELEVDELIEGRKTLSDFIGEFSEEKDVLKLRKNARDVLGIPHDVLDMAQIDSRYKDLAKRYHPDMPEGDITKFKEINHAHKIIKRELL